MKRALSVLLLAACKLLHRGSNDKDKDFPVDTTTPPTVTVAASAPPIESAAPSASALVEDALDAGTTTIDPRSAARQRALREAAEFGMLGLLGGDGGIDNAPWGRDPLGTSPGTIGLGNIGTLGGVSHYDAGAGRHPTVRAGATTVLGRLPPEVIQRIVRQNFGRFRLCYENGLRNNPVLQGRVTTKYVILADGTVTTAEDGGSDMPDQNVVQCVIRAFRSISYPQPEGGIVTVTFPLIFNPS